MVKSVYCQGGIVRKIAIIGAGITGITTAYQLIKKGMKLLYLKKKTTLGWKSFANGGQLSASNAEVWTSWKTVSQGIQWIFKRCPLLFNLNPLHKLTWIFEFLTNIANHEKIPKLQQKWLLKVEKSLKFLRMKK